MGSVSQYLVLFEFKFIVLDLYSTKLKTLRFLILLKKFISSIFYFIFHTLLSNT